MWSLTVENVPRPSRRHHHQSNHRRKACRRSSSSDASKKGGERRKKEGWSKNERNDQEEGKNWGRKNAPKIYPTLTSRELTKSTHRPGKETFSEDKNDGIQEEEEEERRFPDYRLNTHHHQQRTKSFIHHLPESQTRISISHLLLLSSRSRWYWPRVAPERFDIG